MRSDRLTIKNTIYATIQYVHSGCTGLLKLGKNPSLPERERDTIIVMAMQKQQSAKLYSPRGLEVWCGIAEPTRHWYMIEKQHTL